MHFLVSLALLAASVLTPSKNWYAPDAPLNVTVKADGDARLVVTDFAGAKLEGKGPADVSGEATKDLKQLFPQVSQPGTYLVYVVAKGKELPEFEGTPLVVSVREDKRRARRRADGRQGRAAAVRA